MPNHLLCISAMKHDHDEVQSSLSSSPDVEVERYTHKNFDELFNKLIKLAKEPANQIAVLTGGILNYDDAGLSSKEVIECVSSVRPNIRTIVMSDSTPDKIGLGDSEYLANHNVVFVRKMPGTTYGEALSPGTVSVVKQEIESALGLHPKTPAGRTIVPPRAPAFRSRG
jgi:hypothetical protein